MYQRTRSAAAKPQARVQEPSHGVNVNGLIMTNGSLPGQPRPSLPPSPVRPSVDPPDDGHFSREKKRERASRDYGRGQKARILSARRKRRGRRRRRRSTYTRAGSAARPHVLATHVRG